MIKYILKRIANYIVMLFFAVSLTYFLASGFLDPRSNYTMRHPRPKLSSINNSLNMANINDQVPVVVRYGRWLWGIVTKWDWGRSPDLNPIGSQIGTRIIASVQLVTLATILSIIIGVSLGVFTAIRQYHWQDRVLGSIASFFMVVPVAVLGLFVVIAAIYFNQGIGTRVFYVTGLHNYAGSNLWYGLVDFLQHIVLPTLTLTIPGAVGYHITQRTYLLDTINAEYVRTARAKGVPYNVAVRRHALRTSLIPTTVSVAFSITGVFTGAVITETIFGIEGLGKFFITSLGNNDINAITAITAFSGVCTLAGALLADIFAAILDPRIRLR